ATTSTSSAITNRRAPRSCARAPTSTTRASTRSGKRWRSRLQAELSHPLREALAEQPVDAQRRLRVRLQVEPEALARDAQPAHQRAGGHARGGERLRQERDFAQVRALPHAVQVPRAVLGER